jgi:hypothetical protein
MKIDLGGRAWELESLPWRLVKTMQPKFLALWSRLAGLGEANALKVSEADLDTLGQCAFVAVHHVDRALTRDEFEELPITAKEMVTAVPALAVALGLRPAASKEEAADSAKKASIGPD